MSQTTQPQRPDTHDAIDTDWITTEPASNPNWRGVLGIVAAVTLIAVIITATVITAGR